MEIKGTRTEANLRSAISGEAQAAILYEFFASRAKKDGFQEIADIFYETAENEKAHAEIYLLLLDCLNTTDKNLMNSMETELHESNVMYPQFAEIARQEGFDNIANTFEMVGKIESRHHERFKTLKCHVENGSVFSKGTETKWICKNCGHVHSSSDAPDICPV